MHNFGNRTINNTWLLIENSLLTRKLTTRINTPRFFETSIVVSRTKSFVLFMIHQIRLSGSRCVDKRTHSFLEKTCETDFTGNYSPRKWPEIRTTNAVTWTGPNTIQFLRVFDNCRRSRSWHRTCIIHLSYINNPLTVLFVYDKWWRFLDSYTVHTTECGCHSRWTLRSHPPY